MIQYFRIPKQKCIILLIKTISIVKKVWVVVTNLCKICAIYYKSCLNIYQFHNTCTKLFDYIKIHAKHFNFFFHKSFIFLFQFKFSDLNNDWRNMTFNQLLFYYFKQLFCYQETANEFIAIYM